MEQYTVTGMSCAACSARVEKAVSAVPGVTSCSVSLLTNSMGVEGTASAEAVVSAVQAAGYGASLKGAASAPTAAAQEDALADRETPALKRRLIDRQVGLCAEGLQREPGYAGLYGTHAAVSGGLASRRGV